MCAVVAVATSGGYLADCLRLQKANIQSIPPGKGHKKPTTKSDGPLPLSQEVHKPILPDRGATRLDQLRAPFSPTGAVGEPDEPGEGDTAQLGGKAGGTCVILCDIPEQSSELYKHTAAVQSLKQCDRHVFVDPFLFGAGEMYGLMTHDAVQKNIAQIMETSERGAHPQWGASSYGNVWFNWLETYDGLKMSADNQLLGKALRMFEVETAVTIVDAMCPMPQYINHQVMLEQVASVMDEKSRFFYAAGVDALTAMNKVQVLAMAQTVGLPGEPA